MNLFINQKVKFFITAGLLLLCAVILPGCERNDILSLMGENLQFGDGSDGNITVTGSVYIADLYEDDDVTGVITYRGVNKGLNHGAGEYSPQNRRFIKAINFIIESSATLTATAWNGSDNRLGVVWIACSGTFTNHGTINLNGCGGAGGSGSNDENTIGYWYKKAENGKGPGGGEGAGSAIDNVVVDSDPLAYGRSSYGTADINLATWNHIYGSGGGGGSGVWKATLGSRYYGLGGSGGSNAEATTDGGGQTQGSTGEDDGGAGGNGGGAVRIYAAFFENTGTISCNGNNGGIGNDDHEAGGGGGGSGGTIYFESFECDISTGSITCTGGTGGSGGASGPTGDGSAGSVGRIAIKSPVITGTTNPGYYNILQGSY